MVLKYGTSGFRNNSNQIIKYSEKIGEGLAHLMIVSKKLNGFLGIIVTASHNPEKDNGIKIVNEKGEMITKLEEEYLEYYVNNSKDQKLFLNQNNFKIIIGKDNRKSCNQIIDLISKGIKKVDNCNIINVEYITTPIIHYLSKQQKHIKNKDQGFYFINKYIQNINTELKHSPYIDCSGGVGSIILEKSNIKNIKLVCKSFDNILNLNCGSDYLLNNQQLNSYFDNKDNICGCSLDGDADRSIFWVKKNNKLSILDGDHQLVLWCIFLKKKNINPVAVTTSYCNGSAIKFLKDNNIDVKITGTGMKNLINESKKYKNVVYYENNGHGSASLEKEIILSNGDKLIYNNIIGDGIYNVFSIFQILEEINMDIEGWYNLYKKIPSYQFKISSEKLPELQMDEIGNRVIKPLYIQQYLDAISDKYQGRVFIRPSGTEPVIRFYCESEKKLDQMINYIYEKFQL